MYAIHVLNHIVRNQWTWNIEKLPNEVEVNPLIHLSGIQAQGSHTKSFDTKREHSNDLKKLHACFKVGNGCFHTKVSAKRRLAIPTWQIHTRSQCRIRYQWVSDNTSHENDALLGINISPPKGTFEDDGPFTKVGSVSSLAGDPLEKIQHV